MIGIGKSFTGLFVASSVLVIGLAIARHEPTYDTKGVFRTEHLLVDESGVMGATLVAGQPPLELQSKTAGTSPLDFRAGVTNAWDLSLATGSNTDPATITVFANTPTTTPSVNGSINFKIQAGTGGAGGVNLSPDGLSYMDPDGWAADHTILAIGFLGPGTGDVDIHDQGNSHSASFPALQAVTSSSFNTAGGDIEQHALDMVCGATNSGGGHTLTNVCGYFSATNADVNDSLVADQGNVILNRTSGTTLLHGVTTADAGSFHVTNGGTIIEGTSPFGLSVGPTSDDTYFVNGNIAYGYNINADDHLNINFGGYLFGASRFRDLNVYNGKNVKLAEFDAVNGQFFVTDGTNATTTIRAVDGHLITAGTSAPGLGAGCTSGGSSAIAGTDRAMKLTTGASSTSCTITFASTYTVAPVCNVNVEGGTTLPTYTISATQIVMTVNLSATVYDISCTGTAGAT